MTAKPHSPFDRLSPWILVAAGCAVYANSLGGPFIYDDQSHIVGNESIRQLWPPTWMQGLMVHRPVGAFTLALNYAVSGLDVAGYHLANIVIHLCCALALLAVLRRTLRRMNGVFPSDVTCTTIALTIALLWLVHPLNSECVNYLSQRTESLMGVLYLLVLYCAIRSFDHGSARWCGGAVLCCALGMGSKESMASAPLMTLLYDRTFVSHTFGGALRRRPWLYAGLAATWLVLIRALWLNPHGDTIGFDRGVSAWTYALNQCEMLRIYLLRSVWPHPLVLDYGFARELTLADVWLEGALIVGLLALTVVVLHRRSPFGFVGAWFFLLLAPTSSFVPIVTEVGAERRMYLPLVSVVLLLAIAGYSLLKYLERRAPETRLSGRLTLFGGSALLLATSTILGSLTVERNRDYSSSISIWTTVVEANPWNARGHLSLGAALERQGDIGGALERYRRAVDLTPGYADAHGNLGATLGSLGEFEQAAHHLRIAVARRPDHAVAHNNLGIAVYSLGQVEEAITHYRRALELDPNFPRAHHGLGNALTSLQRYEEAASHYRRALVLEPEYAEARRNLDRPGDPCGSARLTFISLHEHFDFCRRNQP